MCLSSIWLWRWRFLIWGSCCWAFVTNRCWTFLHVWIERFSIIGVASSSVHSFALWNIFVLVIASSSNTKSSSISTYSLIKSKVHSFHWRNFASLIPITCISTNFDFISSSSERIVIEILCTILSSTITSYLIITISSSSTATHHCSIISSSPHSRWIFTITCSKVIIITSPILQEFHLIFIILHFTMKTHSMLQLYPLQLPF